MISLKRKQRGFTIVELLIVIVVIGILAAIVITTFVGVQKKGRDADRKADINALYSQIEVYFAQNSRYPELSDLNDATWRSTNMPGLTVETTYAPNKTVAIDDDVDNDTDRYQYTTTPATCDSVDGSDPDCTGFTILAKLENGGEFKKDGSNGAGVAAP